MFFKTNNSIDVNQIDTLLGKIELIDVREPYEYQSGHLPTAKNIPLNTLLANPNQFLNKNEKYHIICQSGGRSSMVCDHLIGYGYNVVNVLGGTGRYRGRLER